MVEGVVHEFPLRPVGKHASGHRLRKGVENQYLITTQFGRGIPFLPLPASVFFFSPSCFSSDRVLLSSVNSVWVTSVDGTPEETQAAWRRPTQPMGKSSISHAPLATPGRLRVCSDCAPAFLLGELGLASSCMTPVCSVRARRWHGKNPDWPTHNWVPAATTCMSTTHPSCGSRPGAQYGCGRRQVCVPS